MADRFVRHTKMMAWGLGIVVDDRGGQRTVLFADGQKRTFKGAIADKLLVDAEPTETEERLALERGRVGGAPVSTRTQSSRTRCFLRSAAPVQACARAARDGRVERYAAGRPLRTFEPQALQQYLGVAPAEPAEQVALIPRMHLPVLRPCVTN